MTADQLQPPGLVQLSAGKKLVTAKLAISVRTQLIILAGAHGIPHGHLTVKPLLPPEGELPAPCWAIGPAPLHGGWERPHAAEPRALPGPSRFATTRALSASAPSLPSRTNHKKGRQALGSAPLRPHAGSQVSDARHTCRDC